MWQSVVIEQEGPGSGGRASVHQGGGGGLGARGKV